MSDQVTYTDVEGQRWVLDPNGTHGWTSPNPGQLSRNLGPFRPWRRLSGFSLPDGEELDNGTLRYYSPAPAADQAPPELQLSWERDASREEIDAALAKLDSALMKWRQQIPTTAARKAMERLVYALTGVEPDPRVIDRLLAEGARAYWMNSR